MSRHPLSSRLIAEFVGTAFLLAGVVGSGIMAETLTDDVGLQLLQNAFATGGVLVALILALGPASGAHFNPAVTLADRVFGGISTRDAAVYCRRPGQRRHRWGAGCEHPCSTFPSSNGRPATDRLGILCSPRGSPPSDCCW